ncbi:MAG: DUF4396 domain-containing protein, partial [Acidobacteriota bacterium]|nr:DUF4396 domain-containing protein [Acidobacteriota bacterium]
GGYSRVSGCGGDERGGTMLSGVMLLWFILTGLAMLFIAIDIRSRPTSPVMKWAFVLITAYTGVIGAFLYVLGCREPLPGMHEQYVASRWRQTLGSTMHCVAGDGLGILAGAVIGATVHLSGLWDISLEYALGFGFGWTIFQALFMKRMGGTYAQALAGTFVAELVSMNVLMSVMVPVMAFLMSHEPGSHNPLSPAFWFIMSMSLLAGLIAAYPANWWLVKNHLKHGMATVRRPGAEPVVDPGAGERDLSKTPGRPTVERKPPESHGRKPGPATLALAIVLSVMLLAAGIGTSLLAGAH